jgi:hypothetical protein
VLGFIPALRSPCKMQGRLGLDALEDGGLGRLF